MSNKLMLWGELIDQIRSRYPFKKQDVVRQDDRVGIVSSVDLKSYKCHVSFIMNDGTITGYGVYDPDQLTLVKDEEWQLAKTYYFDRVREMKEAYD
jgi:hypothetical protein